MNNDVLPANDAIEYVLGAYVFFLLMVLVYIGILGAKFQRISRDIGELTDQLEADRASETEADPQASGKASQPVEESRV